MKYGRQLRMAEQKRAMLHDGLSSSSSVILDKDKREDGDRNDPG